MNQLKKTINLAIISFFLTVCQLSILAQDKNDTTKPNNLTNHYQFTVIAESHAGFKSAYSGNNSLADSVEVGAVTVTSTLFLGRRLWKGAAFYFNPELSGGRGLSSAVGVAGALNGESYRVGNPQPGVFIARAYLQQYIPLGNTSYEYVADDVNQIAGMVPKSRITISAGKFAISDFFDNNKYSHNPRSQFLNWALMGNGAWDYPANTRGYTFGAVVELIKPTWAVRISSVAVPRIANSADMQYNFSKAHSETVEIEKKLFINKRSGNVRLLFSSTHSKAPSYADGIKALTTGNTTLLDIITGKDENKNYGGKKFAICMSADQQLTNEIGVLGRIGWNDGKYASWAFTEIDQTATLGLSVKGGKWKRKEDVAGIAMVVNGLSSQHKDFLAGGGYGFIIGDGKLNYGHEAIVETYYNAHVSSSFWLTVDYQFVTNPAYNKDRGPVHVFGVRGHVEF